MNIFVLDSDPKTAAKMYSDNHVKTMVGEYCQLLCDTHYNLSKRNDIPFLKKGGILQTEWVSESLSNYKWLLKLTYFLIKEHSYRFGKQHKYINIYEWLVDNTPLIKDIGLTEFPTIISNKTDNIIESHQKQYIKDNILIYTKRQKPNWIK